MKFKRPSLLALLLGVFSFASPISAGHLALSANDGKYPMIDGAYKVADPLLSANL